MKVMPWLELQQKRAENTLFLSIASNYGRRKHYQNQTDECISFDAFSVRNTGKDVSFIIGIYIKSSRRGCLMTPNEQYRLLPDKSIVIDIELIALFCNQNESFSVELLFTDLFGNLYISEVNKEIDFVATASMDSIEYPILQYRITNIGSPEFKSVQDI